MAYHELLLSDFREISFLGFFLEREIIANALVYKMLITLLYNKSLFWFITHKISGKGSKNSEYIGRFVLPLRAAAADAQFPFPEEGVARGPGGVSAMAVRPLREPETACVSQGIMMSILLPRPSGTTSETEGEFARAGTMVLWREIKC